MTAAHTEASFRSRLATIEQQTDRMFFWLLIAQWIGAVAVALIWSPRTWIAQYWGVHQHVIAAALLGGLFAAYPFYLIIRQPGTRYTRHMIAVGQMLQSALLVHVTGGRIETHFHVFGSLALLAFYRDWQVLITGGAVVYIDHLALGAWFPLSVYGVPAATIWRALEHAFWVIFEVMFLAMSCRRGIRELRQIAERETALQETNQDLEARVKKRTEELEAFSYSVSHDLRAPLRAIAGFTGVLLEDHVGGLDAEGQRCLDVIRTNTKRMGQLIDDLLTFSRLGRQPLQAVEIDMTTLVQSVFEDLKPLAPGRVPRLELMPLQAARGDQTLIRQVWANLLSNAIKFTRPRELAVITVGGRVEDHQIVYTVTDNGVGFDMEYVQKLFRVFQRLHTQEEFEGTGVGLAIVQHVIDRHGGRVWAEGVVGQGATFSFTLPQGGEG